MAIDERTTRTAPAPTTLDWYAERLAAIQAPFRVVSPPELREEVAKVGRRMLASALATGADDSGGKAGSGPA